jgi:undecaprenyl diphosphate synthase
MEIFGETIERELPDLARQGVRARFLGRRDRAPEELRAQMEGLEEETAHNERLNLWIAFDYGGRAELVEAARQLVRPASSPTRSRCARICTRPNCPTRTC